MSWNFVGKPDASLYPSDFFRWNVGLQDRLAFHADNFVVDERVSLWLQVSEVCFTKRMSEVIFTGTTNSHIQMTSKIDMCREKEEKEESYVHFVHDHLRVSFVTKVKVRSCRKPCQFFFKILSCEIWGQSWNFYLQQFHLRFGCILRQDGHEEKIGWFPYVSIIDKWSDVFWSVCGSTIFFGGDFRIFQFGFKEF